MDERDTPTSLFANLRFLALLGGQGASYVGDAVASVALPLLILALTGSGFQMGLIGALESAPLLLIGLPAGVWVDRLSRKKTMLTADLGRALLMGGIPVAALLHVAMMPVVMVVAMGVGVLTVFFGAAYTGAMPSVVPAIHLGRANAYFEAIESVAYVIGPPLAGVLTHAIGPAGTLGIDALTFLASALAIKRLPDRREDVESPSAPRRFIAELREGMHTVFRDRALTFVTLLWGFNRFAFMALIPALTFFVIRTLGDHAMQVGWAVSVYAIGSFIGTLLSSRIPAHRIAIAAVGGQLVMGIAALFVAMSKTVVPLDAASALLGVGEGVTLIGYLTLRVSRVPEERLGRVYAVTSTLTQGMGAIGFLLIGGTLSLWGGRATWLAMAAATLVSVPALYAVYGVGDSRAKQRESRKK